MIRLLDVVDMFDPGQVLHALTVSMKSKHWMNWQKKTCTYIYHSGHHCHFEMHTLSERVEGVKNSQHTPAQSQEGIQVYIGTSIIQILWQSV